MKNASMKNFHLQEIYNNEKAKVKIQWFCTCDKLHM